MIGLNSVPFKRTKAQSSHHQWVCKKKTLWWKLQILPSIPLRRIVILYDLDNPEKNQLLAREVGKEGGGGVGG